MKLCLAITLLFAGAVGEYALVSFCALYSASKYKNRAESSVLSPIQFKINTIQVLSKTNAESNTKRGLTLVA